MQSIKMTGDYHTHTTYSDGYGSIEDNVMVAIERGLKEVGITDHAFNHIKGCITRADVEKMRAEVNRLQEKYPQIKIYLGVEADLLNFDGDIDLNEDEIKLFDYILLGIHKLTYGKGVKGSYKFNFLNFIMKTKHHRERVTDSYIRAINRYPIRAIVHPNYAVRCNISRLADACAEKGVLLEFNGKRIEYTDADMETLKKSKVKFIFGSDAHYPSKVGDCTLQQQFLLNYDFPLDRIVNIIYTE